MVFNNLISFCNLCCHGGYFFPSSAFDVTSAFKAEPCYSKMLISFSVFPSARMQYFNFLDGNHGNLALLATSSSCC